MSKGAEIVKLAESQLGTRGAAAKEYCGLSSGANYCDAFVTWLYYKCGVKEYYCNGTKQTYCPTSIKLCRKEMPNIPIYLALPGDVIFFDWEPNGDPNHVGIVRERKSDQAIYTVEGNTSGYGTTGMVANKTRTLYGTKNKKKVQYIQGVFRPQFAAGKFDTSKKLEVDGFFGYNSIAMLQKVLMIKVDGILGLGTVKALQKLVGVTADGSWGPKTSEAVQKMVGADVDGEFGPNSVKAFQKWLNKQAFPSDGVATSKTNAQKIADKAYELSYKTNSSKANYPDGKPVAAFDKALKKEYPNRDKWNKASREGASCDVFVGTVIRASGVDSKFPRGLEEQWARLKSGKFKQIAAKAANLKDGDIITYQRNDGTNGGHICIYYDGKIKEAGHAHYWSKTTNKVSERLSTKGKKWVRVYRAK